MLKLVYAPDPILKKECKPLAQVDDHHRALIKEMYEVMYGANGVGLAAPQVGLDMRIFIVDPAAREEEKSPLTMINPKIISIEENLVPYEEGCLSFPEHFAEIDRPDKLSIEYIDENNQKKIMNAEGFTSRIIQHELDHLNGILFVDHLSRLKRDVIIRKMKKFQKEKNIV
jgi:peptide deformylase